MKWYFDISLVCFKRNLENSETCDRREEEGERETEKRKELDNNNK